METNVYNQEGKASGKVNLPEAVFGVKWNADLLHQVVVCMQANARTMVAHTKDRSEVRGGGKKPWRQKGTGRARHGSSRSPIWKGGGVTFGPRNDKDYSKKINKKMKTKALYVALSQKLRDGEILFVDSLSFSEPKTAQAKSIITALSSIEGFNKLVTKKNNSALITLNEKDNIIEKSFDNIGSIDVDEVRNLNALEILQHTYIIIVSPQESVTFFDSKSTFTPVSKETEKKEEVKKTEDKAVAKKPAKKVATKKVAKVAVSKTVKK